MANYYSIADGNLTDNNVFGRSIESADVTTSSTSRTLSPWYINTVPFYINADAIFPIYGVAFHVYLRSRIPTGTLDFDLISPTGNAVATGTYDISLFTEFDGRDNLTTIYPQNWQLLKLASPVSLTETGNYYFKIRSSEIGQIALMGELAGTDITNSIPLQASGSFSTNTPFPNSYEESMCGTLSTKYTPGTYGLGIDDFTVEGYYYFNSFSGDWNPLICLGDGIHKNSALAWGVIYNNSEKRLYFWRNYWRNTKFSVDVIAFAETALAANQWMHIAVCRKNAQLTFFVNGVCVGLQNNNRTNYASIAKKKLQIGSILKDNISITSDMCVSNIRITKEVALYTADFNLTQAPLSLRRNTPFLYADPYDEHFLKADITGNISTGEFDVDANVFNEIDQFKYTKIGTGVEPLTANNPFNDPDAYSVHLTGTHYYTAPESYGNFVTGDFTAEAYIYVDNAVTQKRIFTYSANSAASAASNFIFGLEINNSQLVAIVSCNLVLPNKPINPTYVRSAGGTITSGAWHHVAMVRKDNTLSAYIDGVNTGADVTLSNKLNIVTNPILTIGAEPVTPTTGSFKYAGAIANIRITKGVAIYTANFNSAAPTHGANINNPAPLPTFSSSLTLQNELILQPVWYDAAHPSEQYTNTTNTIPSDDSPFYNSNEKSLTFVRAYSDTVKGTPSIETPYIPFDADFTIEAWINLTTLPVLNYAANISHTNAYTIFAVGSNLFGLNLYADKITVFNGTNTLTSNSHGITTNTWHHIAVVCKRGMLTFYKNGIALGNAIPFIFSSSINGAIDRDQVSYGTNYLVTIGSENSTTGFFDGKIIDLRITRGTALYTSNFNSGPITLNQANISAPEPLNAVNITTGTGINNNSGTVVGTQEVPNNRIPSSYYFDGNYSNYTVANSNLRLSYNNLTVEFWIKPTAEKRYGNIFDIGFLTIAVGDNNKLRPISGTSSLGAVLSFKWIDAIIYTQNININSWVHVAVVRNIKEIQIFVNGSLAFSKIYSNIYYNSTSLAFNVGASLTNTSKDNNYEGYLANFRYALAALYSANHLPDATADAAPISEIITPSNLPLQQNTTGVPTINSSAGAPSNFDSNTTYNSIQLYGVAGYSPLLYSAPLITGDFTIEAWMYFDTISTYSSLFEAGTDWSLVINNTAGLKGITFNLGDGYGFYTRKTPATNTWFHIAVCRKDNVWYIYLNGVSLILYPLRSDLGTAAHVAKVFKSAITVMVGKQFAGRVLTARIINNEAKYAIAASAAAAAIPDIADEPEDILHLQLLEDTGSIFQVTDTASSSPTLSYAPTVTVDNRLSKLVGYNKTMFLAKDRVLNFGTRQESFTIECSLKAPRTSTNPRFILSTISHDPVWCGAMCTQRTLTHNESFSSGSQEPGLLVFISSAGWVYFVSTYPFQYIVSATQIKDNTWFNLKIQKTNTTVSLYIDDVLDSQTTWSQIIGNMSKNSRCSNTMKYGGVEGQGWWEGVRLGRVRSWTDAGGFECFNAGDPFYISNLVVSLPQQLGINMLIPASSIKETSNDWSLISDTGLSTGSHVAVQSNNTLYGANYSLYFNGTSRLLYNNFDSNFITNTSIGTGDFTAEAWIYPTKLQAIQTIICYSSQSSYTSQNTSNSFNVRIYRDDVDPFVTPDDRNMQIVGDLLVGDTIYTWFSAQHTEINTWTHIALVRKNSKVSLLINGAPVMLVKMYVNQIHFLRTESSYAFTNTSNLHLTVDSDSKQSITIGCDSATNSSYFTGYMQNVRISKKSIYNFTIPESSFNLPTEIYTGSDEHLITAAYPFGFVSSLFTQNDTYMLWGKGAKTQTYSLIGQPGSWIKQQPKNEIDITRLDNYTIDFWFKPTNSKTQKETFLTIGPISFIINYSLKDNNDRKLSVFTLQRPQDYCWHVYDGWGVNCLPLNQSDIRGLPGPDAVATSNQCIVYNEWHYVVFTRTVSSNTQTLNLYVNGNLEATWSFALHTSLSTNRGVITDNPGIISFYDISVLDYIIGSTTFPAQGGISNVRVRKNVSSYDGFIPSGPFVPDQNTVFLVNDTSGFYHKADNKSIQLGVIPSPFPDSIVENSIYVNKRNGNTYIKHYHKDFTFNGKYPFTVEGWIMPTEDLSTDSTFARIWRTDNQNATLNFGIRNMIPEFYSYAGTIKGSAPLVPYRWYYFAIVQDNNKNIYLYISNGTDQPTYVGDAYNFTSVIRSEANLTSTEIASNFNASSYIGEDFTGYISNVRESKEALYSDATISIPFEPLSVTSSTLFLLQYPYNTHEYKYYEPTSSIIMKPNTVAFNSEQPASWTLSEGSIHSTYCIIPPNFSPDLLLARKTFTIEWFAKIEGWKPQGFPIFYLGNGSESACLIGLRYITSNNKSYLRVVINHQTGNITTNVLLPAGINLFEWHHTAVTRADDYLNIFINGSFINKIKLNASYIDVPTQNSYVGAFLYSSIAQIMKGYLSNVRLVLDDVIYPQNSTPVEPLSNSEGTALLIQGPFNSSFVSNGTGGVVALMQVNSPLDFDPSPSRNVHAPEDCMYFNGARYLNIIDNEQDYNLGESKTPFTLELWVYSFADTTKDLQVILNKGGGMDSWSAVRGFAYALYTQKGNLVWSWSNGNGVRNTITFANFAKKYTRTWVHVAVTYDGNITRLFANGIEVASLSTTHKYDYSNSNTGLFRIGTSTGYTHRYCPYNFAGYISNIRIVQNDCLYTGSNGNFLPPDILTTVTGTVLLLQAPYNNELEFKFQASPFDPSVIERLSFLDGKKFLKTATNIPTLTKDFTIEFYLYATKEPYYSANMIESIMDNRATGVSLTPFTIRINEVKNKLRLFVGHPINSSAGSQNTFIDVGNIVRGTWTHFSIERKDNVVMIFQDGIMVGAFRSPVAWGGNPLIIGKQLAGLGYGENNFIGYLSNIRIVDGEAVHVPINAVSTEPLTAQNETAFLLKAGINLDKSIITTQTENISDTITPALKTDCESYTALTQGTPWDTADATERSFMAFGVNGQYIRFAESNAFNLYNRPFVFETWINRESKLPSTRGYEVIYGCLNWSIGINNDNLLQVGRQSSNIEIPFNEWVHIAVVYNPATDPGVIKLYYNGELNYVFPKAAIPGSYRPIWCLGRRPVDWFYLESDGLFSSLDRTFKGFIVDTTFKGLLSNIRLVKGSGSIDVRDTTDTHTITNKATSTVQSITDSPNDASGEYSAYFDGTSLNSRLITQRRSVFANQFTIETYVKCDLDDISNSNSSGYGYIYYCHAAHSLRIRFDGTVEFFHRGPDLVLRSVASPADTYQTNTWTHIAITRNTSHQLLLYVDGVLVASSVYSGQIGSSSSSQPLCIGSSYGGNEDNQENFQGSICGFKINNTDCLYTGPSITPPFPLTADSHTTLMLKAFPVTNSYTCPYLANFTPPSTLTNIPGTVFLLKAPYNVWNGTSYITHTAPIIPAANPFTGSSAYSYLESKGEYSRPGYGWGRSMTRLQLKKINSHILNNKFTIKFWVNIQKTNPTRKRSIHDSSLCVLPWDFQVQDRHLIRTAGQVSIVKTTDNKIVAYLKGTQLLSQIKSTTALPLNQWSHIALVGDGDSVCLFINGILEAASIGKYQFTKPSDDVLNIGGSSINWTENRDWVHCGDGAWCCTTSHVVHQPADALISDVQMTTGEQLYITTITSQGPIFNNISGTVFLYQPNYDTYYHQTDSGTRAFVNNTTVPDNTAGIQFDRKVTTFIKTQPLPVMAGDFLIELWMKPSGTTEAMLLDGRGEGPASNPWWIAINRGGPLNVSVFGGGSSIITSANNTLILNEYNHIALLKTNNSIILYVNHKIINAAFNTFKWGGGTMYIGKTFNNLFPLNGFIKSVRIVNGNSVYPVRFNPMIEGAPTWTPHTAALITDPLYCIAAPDSTGAATESGFVASCVSSSAILERTAPFSNLDNICYFHWNRSIIIPHNENQNLANIDWSIEFWMFPQAYNTKQTMFRKGSGSSLKDMSYVLYLNNDRSFTFTVSRVDTKFDAVGLPVTSIVADTATTPTEAILWWEWNHVLLVSDGTTTEMFVNGKYFFTFPFIPTNDVSAPLCIGSSETGADEFYNGYLSNFKIDVGENVRTTNIDVPTEAWPDNNTDDSLFDDNVELLLHGDGPNNSTVIIDSSTNNYSMSAMGNCHLNTITNKFGNSSIVFSGPGDFIQGTFTDAGKFGIADFTLEFWIQATSAPQNGQTIISFNIFPNVSGFSLKYTSTSFQILVGSKVVFTDKVKWSLNRWHYIALSRVNQNLKIFIDGDFLKSIPFTVDCTDGLRFIGRSTATTSAGMFGFIEELRITQGVGRYNTDFPVPVEPPACTITTSLILKSPYTEYTYYTYGVEGIHVAGSIIGTVNEPRLIEVTADAIINNLFIHNGGTLHIDKTTDAKLEIFGSKGIQITSGGSLNIN